MSKTGYDDFFVVVGRYVDGFVVNNLYFLVVVWYGLNEDVVLLLVVA